MVSVRITPHDGHASVDSRTTVASDISVPQDQEHHASHQRRRRHRTYRRMTTPAGRTAIRYLSPECHGSAHQKNRSHSKKYEPMVCRNSGEAARLPLAYLDAAARAYSSTAAGR